VAEHKSSSLLDAKSNELEIVEFSIREALYGINVAKVREIIKASVDFVPVPDAHPSIIGAINLRGSIIPVVDLAKHIKMPAAFDAKQNRIIIAEFNRICLGFLVSAVSRIHRLSWKSVEAPSQMLQTGESYTSGIVKVGEKVIFLLDFEKVASHINPNANIQSPRGGEYGASSVDRTNKKILVVDDSDFTRLMIVQHLQAAGYQTETATNGAEAWQRLSSLKDSPGFNDITRSYNMVVTDIEMPQMDGLHLIKNIKEDSKLNRLPCVAFSSIISKDIIVQCRKCGADGEISKPEINQLVSLVDSKVL
jgi:two-component system, chemotaxis family, chemotaxis protein CheV